jgi:putative ABC transport system permease protein
MNDLGKQLVQAVRVLRKSPGFTFSALVILTLGIGANTAIFGIVDALLLKPLPFLQPASIVSIYQVPPPESFPGLPKFAVSAANYIDWRKQNGVFESMAVLGGRAFRLGGGARPQTIHAILTEPDFFRVLRVQPAVGRAFTALECQPGRDDVTILSDGFARSHFGSAERALGGTLELNGRNYRVIGVMAQEFQLRIWFAANKEAWMPLAWTPERAAIRGNHNLSVIARLKDGASVAQAQSEMNVISERLAHEYPQEDKGWGATVVSLHDDLVGDVGPALLTLLGAVGFVLLIACANTANLVLVRTITRRKEFAIRAALGARAGQLLRPVLVETTLLALAGGALGLLFARSGQALVINALANEMPGVVQIELNARVLGFTMIASLLTGTAAGMIAAWRLTKANLNASLKSGLGKTDADSGGKGTRRALVVAEVALSLVLLVGAGLMIRSLWSLYQVDPGFVSSGVTTMTVPIPESAATAHRNRFYDEFLSQVRRIPGVTSAAAIDTLPLTGGGSQQPIVIDGRPREVFALQPNVGLRMASPGYLRTMEIPLLAGRDFTDADTDGKHPVVLISHEMARQFWPGETPIGKRLRSSFSPDISREVVGVTGDIKERGLDVLQPVAMLYVPLEQGEKGTVSLVVRTEGDASGLGSAVARVLREIDPELPLRDVMPMDELLATSLAQHRFSMFLFVAMAGLAFVLGAVGIYSVLAHSVRSRVQEISIRMALGAQVRDVIRLVLVEGMKPALIGIALGTFGAWMLSGTLSRLVYGISTTDPYTFATAAALLGAVAVGACLLPAWRATRVDPASALRGE